MATIKTLINYLKNSLMLATARTAKLNVLKRRYISGDKTALIDTLKMYIDNDRTELPNWVASAVFKALNQWRDCEVKTLDEAFGVERPKNFDLEAARRIHVIAFLYPVAQAKVERLNIIQNSFVIVCSC
jgi:hypothetical protein